MRKKEILADPFKISYEYEIADNGAILAEPEIRRVIVSSPVSSMPYQLGESILSEIKGYMDKFALQAVRINIKIEGITPKY